MPTGPAAPVPAAAGGHARLVGVARPGQPDRPTAVRRHSRRGLSWGLQNWGVCSAAAAGGRSRQLDYTLGSAACAGASLKLEGGV